MNVTKAPIDNPNLRQLVAAAVDRAAVIATISFGIRSASFAFDV